MIVASAATVARQQGSTKLQRITRETMASLGAATGAASGAVIGGAIGWLMGMGFLSISDIGPFTWAGPLMAAFTGFTAGGFIGGLAGVLIGMFIPDL